MADVIEDGDEETYYEVFEFFPIDSAENVTKDYE